MATSYNVVNIDLAVAVPTPVRLAATLGKRVSSVFVSACPAGTTAYFRLGNQNADRISVAVNQTFSFCPPEGDGIFFEQPVAGVGALQLIISYEDAGSAGLTAQVG